jgi:prepilin-type N-terminal cleavage/methylation domain-containing protein
MFKVQSSRAWNPEHRQSGFTLLELMAAIVIISVLAAVLLDRLAHYQEMAERAAMDSMVRTIKTGLQIRLAELIIANRQAEAAALEAEDPIRWLDAPPANYGGAYGASSERGKWYFDAPGRQLVYIVNNGDGLELDAAGGVKQIRFRARLQKDPMQFGGAAVESVTGITLTPVTPYRWR